MTFYREFVIGGNFDMFIRPFITILPIVVKLPDVEWLSLPGYLDVVWWENRNLSCLQVSWRVLPLPRGRSRLPRQCAGVQWGETRGFCLSRLRLTSLIESWRTRPDAARNQKSARKTTRERRPACRSSWRSPRRRPGGPVFTSTSQWTRITQTCRASRTSWPTWTSQLTRATPPPPSPASTTL